MAKHQQRLKRLPPEYYHGFAWVHETLTIENRQQGWLEARLLYKFRELLTHVAFRDRIACPDLPSIPHHRVKPTPTIGAQTLRQMPE